MTTGDLFPTPLRPWQGGKPVGPPTLPAAATPHNGTPTSKAAAASLRGAKAGRLRAKVLEAIREHGSIGCHTDGLEVYLGMSHQSCSARVNELHRAGLIVAAGDTRATRSGRQALIWRVTG